MLMRSSSDAQRLRVCRLSPDSPRTQVQSQSKQYPLLNQYGLYCKRFRARFVRDFQITISDAARQCFIVFR
ncbi:hypothetical protein OCEANICA350_20023 [Oceanicaulis sp. 350]|nr:hypothetical protein OCEANICA350_20023 [Oceanicaulis sp. 350]